MDALILIIILILNSNPSCKNTTNGNPANSKSSLGIQNNLPRGKKGSEICRKILYIMKSKPSFNLMSFSLKVPLASDNFYYLFICKQYNIHFFK